MIRRSRGRVLLVLVALISGLLALVGAPNVGAAGPSSVVQIYWSDSGTVNRANPDGTNSMVLAAGFARIDDVELDQVANKLYWNNWQPPPPGSPAEGIYQSDLNGANQILLTSASSNAPGNASGLHGIDVDGANGVVYFTRGVSYANVNGAEVSKVNTNGTGYTKLIGANGVTWFPSGIVVDGPNGLVYWGDPGVINFPPNGAVNVMTTAGAGPATLVPWNPGDGRSLAQDGNLIFFSSFLPGSPFLGGAIHVHDLSNNTTAMIYADPNTGIPDIEVDPSAMRVYFTDYANGTISSVDYTGANKMDHIVGLQNPFGLDLELQTTVDVDLDIHPRSCPNPLNVKAGGVTPAAVLGSATLDVNDIDVATLALEGVAPVRSAIEDVAAPFGGAIQDPPQRDDCTTAGPDGFDDLTLKFPTKDLAAALGAVNDGDVLVLTLTGQLTNGTSIEGVDVVWIRKKGN